MLGLSAHAAGLLGGTVSITNDYPDTATVYAGPSVGPTNAAVGLVGYGFTFTPDTITFSNPYCCNWGVISAGQFNGFVLAFSGVPTISGVSLDPASQLAPASLAVSNNTVYVSLVSGGPRFSGEQGVFDVTFAGGAPEPSTWAMLLSGFAAIGGALRRRRGAFAV